MSASIPEITVGLVSENTTFANGEIKEKKLENNEDTIDVLELASLLQCLGFSLQSFDRAIDIGTQPSSLCDINADDYLQIEMMCMKSRTKAILLKEKIGCKCPSKEDTSNAQFWNISACSPSLPGNVTISKSSLLPTISVEKSREINDLLLKALNIVNVEDTNGNTGNFGDLFEKSATIARSKLLENKIEPKSETSTGHSSSPAGTSSPIPDSSNILRNISLDPEHAIRLLESLRTAENILTDAVNLTNQNSTFTKRTRRMSDIKISPLAAEDQKSGNSSILNASKPDNSSCKTTPKKKVLKRIATGDKRNLVLPPSRIGLLKGKTPESASSTSSRLLSLKKHSIPRPAICNDKSMKLNSSASKTKMAIKSDSYTKSKTPSKIASFASTGSTKNTKKTI